MTNIINGIDVSECSYYNKDNEPYCCEIWDNECEAQNCYFKQFKRLEQQIEAYQLSENEAKEIIAELKHKNKKLQEENEELKERFNELYNNAEQLANKYNKYGDNKENELVEIINKTTDERNKYKQALEEIREVAEICMSKNIDNCYTCKFYNECEIEDAEIPTRDVCKLIKNKVNEVFGNE